MLETPVVTQLFKDSHRFTETDVSSPRLQDPASFPHPWPDESTSRALLSYLRSILILSSHLRLGGLLSGFTIKTNLASSPCVLRAQLSLSP